MVYQKKGLQIWRETKGAFAEVIFELRTTWQGRLPCKNTGKRQEKPLAKIWTDVVQNLQIWLLNSSSFSKA
jgi:hypothetical protein